MPNRLIQLDFHEYDTAAALILLSGMVERGEVSGMVFACIGKNGVEPVFGATGVLASNDIMAAGLSSILCGQFAQPYLSCAG